MEWALGQRKDKRVKGATAGAKFPPASFSERKEKVIELPRRVCAASVETVKIIREMEQEE